MILAAGRGTRMWPLTDNTPKPLLPLGGTTIIQRQIEELTKVGVKEIHVLIGYRMKAISNHLGNGEKLGVKIQIYHSGETERDWACCSSGEWEDKRGILLPQWRHSH